MRRISQILLLLFFPAAACGGWLAYYAITPRQLPSTPLEVTIQPGVSLKQAASKIRQAGVLEHEWPFILLARLRGKAGQIRPGIYEFNGPLTPMQLLDMLSKGQVAKASLTIVEGSTFRQLRALLRAHPGLLHDTDTLSDSEILQRIGASEPHPEGLFFPDTYVFDRGSSDLVVLEQAYRMMQRHLQENWQNRAADLPLATPYQALILASIVEKETGQAADRPMIAAVFINRLRHPMRLQTDPTVIYGLGDKFDGNLRKKDLLADTPYNTYSRDGLPPTPIALPGLASIQAVLHPASSRALYFVARGDGSSQFSENLDQHNQAVKRYQLNRK